MAKKRRPLTRERILTVALEMLDQDGAAGLSMRKLANALDVEAMSLYNHVRDKQDLLSGLVDLALSRIELPNGARPWRDHLEDVAIKLYEALIQHPALMMVIASEQGQPTDMRVLQGMDSIVAALAASGLSASQQVSAFRGLLALCFGFVVTHTQGLSKSKQEAEHAWAAWDSSQLRNAALPHLSALAPEFHRTHADDDFRFMLKVYLDALHLQGTV